jgi:hypothetical protein
MSTKPAEKPGKRASRIEQLLAIWLIVLASAALPVVRSVSATEIPVTVISALGIVIVTIAIVWGTRWKLVWMETAFVIGFIYVCYTVAQFILDGQFLLALGAFSLIVTAFVYSIVRRRFRQRSRN